jgi:hypothetical protein
MKTKSAFISAMVFSFHFFVIGLRKNFAFVGSSATAVFGLISWIYIYNGGVWFTDILISCFLSGIFVTPIIALVAEKTVDRWRRGEKGKFIDLNI